MIWNVVFIVSGIAVVLWGADRFTDGASGLARRLKVSELVIGLTVVALGTSLPEFIVSFIGALHGNSDMSAGNIVGSNAFNSLVVVGMAAVMMHIKVERSLLVRDLPISLLASLLLFVFAFTGGRLDRWEGLALLSCFAAYLLHTCRVAMCQRRNAAAVPVEAMAPVWKLMLLLVAGMAALVVGGRMLVNNATDVAKALHVSESIIGLTILAAGTSLPELAASIVAARKGCDGLALGNAIGSNIFNIAFVLGVCGSIVPMPITDITALDWTVLIGSNVLLWLVAIWGRRLDRREGVLLVLCYVAYFAALVVTAIGK